VKRPILLLARELHLGGSERQLTEVALGLRGTNYEPHVGTFRPDGLRGDQLRAAGVPVVQFPVQSFRSFAAASGAWKMARYIQQHKIGLLHSFDAPLTVYGMPVGRYFTSAKLLSSQRGHRELTSELRTLLRYTDSLVDGIVVNCKYLQKHLVEDEEVAESKIHLCYNGIDLEQFCPGPSMRPQSLSESALVIGVVCALRPEKSLETLIQAFARVRPLQKQMKLAIVGSGPVLPELQSLAKQAGVLEDCIWEPATAEVPQWLRNFDIFVLPSLNEALSNSLMEAMACGCAVIASNVGGNPELVAHQERGLLFEPRSADALAGMLRELIQDADLRQRLAKSGENFIRGRFSREASVSRMTEIYDAVLASRRR
jgi:glycosyltransferase involved in cell wall biosynthesis